MKTENVAQFGIAVDEIIRLTGVGGYGYMAGLLEGAIVRMALGTKTPAEIIDEVIRYADELRAQQACLLSAAS